MNQIRSEPVRDDQYCGLPANARRYYNTATQETLCFVFWKDGEYLIHAPRPVPTRYISHVLGMAEKEITPTPPHRH